MTDDNLSNNAGHEATIHEWAKSEAGKQFAEEASEREKAEKVMAKAQKPVQERVVKDDPQVAKEVDVEVADEDVETDSKPKKTTTKK